MDLVVVGQAVVEQRPQLLGRLGALRAPPEPAALGLVQRAEEDGHAGVAQPLELLGDGVDVAHQQRVVGVGRRAQRRLHVEVGRPRVEAAPPRVLVRVVQPRRRVPVPQHRHDAAPLVVRDRLLHRRAHRAPLHPRRRVVHQVDRHQRRRLARLLRDPVRVRELLLARQDLLAVDGAEVVVQRPGVRVGGRVDGRLVDVVRRPRRRGGQRDGVDEVPRRAELAARLSEKRERDATIVDAPSPVAHDVDRVGALLQQDLAGGDVVKGVAGREVHLAVRAAVEDDGGPLLAVDGGDADAQVVQLGGIAVDVEGDLVSRLVEARDVAGPCDGS